jgi:mitogen-activated protein kinase 1/3/mitogen-activated protein kinase 6
MHFDVDQRYSLIDVVGRGAYGVVCAARDDANGEELVAIKKINSAFEHAVCVCGFFFERVY